MQSTISSFFTKKILNTENKHISNTGCSKIYSKPTEYVLFFDGCSKRNPGPAGAGAVIYHNGVEIWSKSLFVGSKETNNVAEYMGMIIGIEEAKNRGIHKLLVKGDSNLVIQQMNGKFKVKSHNLIKLYLRARKSVESFHSIEFQHVYRTDNKRADELANISLTH
tara:strand:+ start:3274 stop:3768 length:495 start_codon:yes stop_codon:yes gene_type:complete